MPIIRFIKNLKNKLKKAKRKKNNDNINSINNENMYYKKNYVPSHDEAVENAVNAARKYLEGYI